MSRSVKLAITACIIAWTALIFTSGFTIGTKFMLAITAADLQSINYSIQDIELISASYHNEVGDVTTQLKNIRMEFATFRQDMIETVNEWSAK